MKQKIHIPCHPQLSLRPDSYREAKRIEKSSIHFQISKLTHLLFFSFFFFLFSFFSNAQQPQPYEWEWAMSGGASLGGSGSGSTDEQIFDIKVGTDSNYYFIGTLVGPYNTNLNGVDVPSYNNSNTGMGNGANDIFLFSTDRSE